MKQVRFGTAASLLLCLGLGEPALASSSVVSPHLRRVQEAVEAWQASGRREPLLVPATLSGAVRRLEAAPGSLTAAGADAADPMLSVILRTTDPEILRMSGARVRTVAGPVVTADVPLSLIDQLESMPGVTLADVPRRLKPLLDVSRIDTRADVAHGGSQPPYTGATGQGVVVGVVDTGIDLDHGDFLNANGTTRVMYVWDQGDNVGPHPSGYNYGTEWNAASINAGTFREMDDDGHGTHVAGIAAGNGRAATNQAEQYDFAGIAPEADIIFVKTIFNEDAIIDGVAWIQSRAGVKPSSINLSVGSQYGPHDGTSLLDVALANLAGPGRIIVAAAGNEGNSFIHAEVQVPGNGSVDMPFLVCTNPGSSCGYTPNAGNDSGRGNDWILLEGYSTGSNFSVTVLTPNQTQVGPVGATGSVSTNTSQGNVDIYASQIATNEREILIDIWDKSSTAPPATGTWIVRIQNNQPTAREIDFWIYFWQLGAGYVNVYWDNGTQAENAELISSPASSDSVIAVGAYITKVAWPCVANPGGACGYISAPPVGEIAPFSSPGPRRDGYAKPEISAPGMGIASSLSKDASGPLFISPYGEMPGGLRYVSQGTSQSSPHVAGAAALLLQLRPNASVRDVGLALMGSVRQDSYTGTGYSNDFGFGKLDVAAALELFQVPVRLLSLTAQWEEGNAVVSWELTETEEGASFRVDRGPSAEGPFTPQSDWLHGDLSFRWTDPAPVAAEPWYRVRSLDRTGEEQTLGVVALTTQPAITRLLANSPNPFRASTRIAFDLARAGNVTVDVLDIAGRLVTRLVSGPLAAGRNEIEWNGVDGTGRHVAPGIYVVRLTTPNTVLARRMVMAS